MNEQAEQMQESTTVHRLECSVDWPPENVAAYFVDCAEPILFDAGMAGETAREELTEDVASHGYELADIEHLVVTHPHTDHIGQVQAVIDAADSEVYAPASIQRRFERDPEDLSDTVRANAQAAGVQGEYLDDAVEMSVESLKRDSSLLPSEAVDHWLGRGETVDVGPLTVETVHTPGHQADHLCYLSDLDGERVLFSGDMALGTFRPVAMHTGFDDGYEDAIGEFYAALDTLADLDVDRVFTGHDDPHTEFDVRVQHDRESLDRLLDRTQEALENGSGATAVEIAFQRSGDRNMEYLVIETASALAHLDGEGVLTSETDDHGVRRYEVA
ncbi:MBL fold metallo-hydrolase [Halorientalis pallida]|uniref:MBL fold metallo-hydrolase n=1 Tax=Halorientalis pallida TaxID=2479928 RepID=A0A498L4S9_9EURY|nr:MBL fold metallo-hydrolase [Halorientalis pallida]RXK49302.1 MBL fold metallo-hydrolase [Halorientalis pallida]